MTTGNTVNQVLSATSAPATGNFQQSIVYLNGQSSLQACSTVYLEVELIDPSNTGDPAAFEVQLFGGLTNVNTPLSSPITSPGLYTVDLGSHVTYWIANLISLSGGVSPRVTVNGLVGE